MGTAGTWLKLAAHARSIANDMRDPYSEKLMREIAWRYETLASRASSKWPPRTGLDRGSHSPAYVTSVAFHRAPDAAEPDEPI